MWRLQKLALVGCFLQTRIFVTNAVTYLPNADQVVVLKNGVVVELGPYEELISHNREFAEYIAHYLMEQANESGSDDSEGACVLVAGSLALLT